MLQGKIYYYCKYLFNYCFEIIHISNEFLYKTPINLEIITFALHPIYLDRKLIR